MNIATIVRRCAATVASALWPPFRQPQQAARPDLFEDAAPIALLNMQAKGANRLVVHRDSTPWSQAARPWPGHRCRTQTVALIGESTFVYRCACGATRGEPPRDLWVDRNSGT
jgi:hypothetical protein